MSGKLWLQVFGRKSFQNAKSFMARTYSSDLDSVIPKEVLEARAKDMPVEMENPYTKDKHECILCKYKVHVDYKNVRLLSQFVSRHSGLVYSRHVSGLCERQQNIILKAIRKARTSGLMPYTFKNPIYLNDPQLFKPEKPFRPHKY